MRIAPDFKIEDFEKAVLDQIERRERAMINAYIQAGEEFIRMARTKTKAENGFGDITGNLRSSMGYAVFIRKQQIHQYAERGGNGTDQETGLQIGIDYAIELGKEVTNALTLVVYAGMDYARAVEDNNRDVISGSSLLMESRLKELIQLSI